MDYDEIDCAIHAIGETDVILFEIYTIYAITLYGVDENGNELPGLYG